MHRTHAHDRRSGSRTSQQWVRIVILIPVLAAAAAAAPREGTIPPPAGSCQGSGGAQLTQLSDRIRIGQPLQLRITGKRLQRFSLIADVGSGPNTLPGYGTFCLDLGPQMYIVVDGIRRGAPRIRNDGAYVLDLEIPDRPALKGRQFHVQGAVLDDDAPNGVAITNAISLWIESDITEDFSTTEFRDDAETTARWEGNDVCVGGISTRTVRHEPEPASSFRLPHPLISSDDPFTPDGCRFQMLFRTTEVSAEPGERLVGMRWSPRSATTFAATYRGMTVRLAQFTGDDQGTLSPFFESNYFGPATVVFQGDYTLESAGGQQWVDWPAFQTSFQIGTRPLLFEIDIQGGGEDFQLFRNRSVAAFPRTRLLANSGDTVAFNRPENTTYHTEFVLRNSTTNAQSKFYSAGYRHASFEDAELVVNQPQGTEIAITYQGAWDGNGDGVPERLTGWVTNPSQVDGVNMIRFRLELTANSTTGAIPAVGSIRIPMYPQ